MKRSYRVYIFSLMLAAVLVPGIDLVSHRVLGQTKPPATPTPTPTPPTIKDEDQVIRVDTELVNLSVRVVDRNNRPINNLPEGEFNIFEDNVPQPIKFFSRSEVPTHYSLVVDNSGSLRQQIQKIIEASKIIIETNKPADETSVIRFVSSDKIEIIQDFTSNKQDLMDALDNFFIEGGQTAIRDALYLSVQRLEEFRKAQQDPTERTRRALILVSDGEDRDSYYSDKQLFSLLRESDVQIYVIGFVDDLETGGGFISKSPQAKAKEFLERLATETGGRSYFPKAVTELNGIASEIASELRTQYSIGYEPTNDRNDGTYRNIKVTVKDGPNKEKRIAITKAGRTAGNDAGPSKPAAAAVKPGS
jgi:Ca-activated chloride channel family protein